MSAQRATDTSVPTQMMATHIPEAAMLSAGSGEPPQVLSGWVRGAKIGSGGMGAVYLAHKDGVTAALKIIRPDVLGDGEVKERFAREIQGMRKVQHRDVVRLLDAGEEQGWPWMALEYMPSGDLSGHLKRRGQLFEKQAIHIAIQIAEGLQALHAVGLVHRDLKPANIFLDKTHAHGTDAIDIKIGDLGMARSSSGDDRMTLTGTACGTPSYMAPEQVRGEVDLDGRVDLYALGGTLFTVLTGREPFIGDTIYVVTHAVLNEPLPNIKTYNPAISDGMVGIIQKLCAKDRHQRYREAGEVLDDLTRLRDGRQLLHVAAPSATRIFQEVMGAPAPRPAASASTSSAASARVNSGGGVLDGLFGIEWAPILRIVIPGALACVALLGVLTWMNARQDKKGATTTHAQPEIIDGVTVITGRLAGFPLRFVWLPPTLGNAHGTWLQSDEISNGLFAAAFDNTVHDPNAPAGSVGPRDAQLCCDKLNAKHPGLAVRLPEENEWQRAVAWASDRPVRGASQPEVLALWERRDEPSIIELSAALRSSGPEPVQPLAVRIAHLSDNHQEWVIAADGQTLELRGGSYANPQAQCHPEARHTFTTTAPWHGFRLAIPGGPTPTWPAGLLENK